MNEIALRDHTPVRDPACQVLCREIQDRIDAGSCRLVDLLDEDDDVQNVYHNWDE